MTKWTGILHCAYTEEQRVCLLLYFKTDREKSKETDLSRIIPLLCYCDLIFALSEQIVSTKQPSWTAPHYNDLLQAIRLHLDLREGGRGEFVPVEAVDI